MSDATLSSKLFAKAKTNIPGGVNSPVRAFRNVGGDPFFVRRAKGCRMEDVDGRSMIDYVGTWGPAILGHAPQCVIEAVHTAAKDGVSFGTPNLYEIEMAQTIVDWVPSVEKVRMVNSGTEATMSCVRCPAWLTSTPPCSICSTLRVIRPLISRAASALRWARPRTSEATTAKPRP